MVDTTGYFTSGNIRKRYGISRSTLHRWLKSPEMNFPKPIRMKGRPYFSKDAVMKWELATSRAVDDTPPADAGPPAISPIIEDYDGLIEALRKRRNNLGLSMNALEDVSGLQSGYVAKLESPTPGPHARGLGKVSLPLLLGGLKAGLVLVDMSGSKR